jgi:hypothetical protein
VKRSFAGEGFKAGGKVYRTQAQISRHDGEIRAISELSNEGPSHPQAEPSIEITRSIDHWLTACDVEYRT